MRSSTGIATLLLLFVAVAGAAEMRAAGDQAFVASTGSTVAISNDASAAARLVAALTMARVVMRQAAAVDTQLPVRAFAVKNEASLRELVPQYWEGRGVRPYGASFSGPNDAFIAIRTNVPVKQHFPLVLHEFVHLLTATHVVEAPAWMDEGLSEFWGAAILEGGNIVIGRPPAQHLKLLRKREWLPPDEMQQNQRGKLAGGQDRVAMFYAQSWAMVHYLLLGRESTAPRSFAPPEREWTPQLESAVRSYIAEGHLREVAVAFTAVAAVPVSARPISEARALSEKANMLVFGERPDAALQTTRRALSLDPREPLGLEVIGTYHFLRNEPDQARDWFARALEADPTNHRAALYLALLSSSAPDRERYLQVAVTAKPDLMLAWQRLWALYIEDGRAEEVRRWCSRATELVRPWWWVNQPLACAGKNQW